MKPRSYCGHAFQELLSQTLKPWLSWAGTCLRDQSLGSMIAAHFACIEFFTPIFSLALFLFRIASQLGGEQLRPEHHQQDCRHHRREEADAEKRTGLRIFGYSRYLTEISFFHIHSLTLKGSVDQW